jgi:hypothetical protein
MNNIYYELYDDIGHILFILNKELLKDIDLYFNPFLDIEPGIPFLSILEDEIII